MNLELRISAHLVELYNFGQAIKLHALNQSRIESRLDVPRRASFGRELLFDSRVSLEAGEKAFLSVAQGSNQETIFSCGSNARSGSASVLANSYGPSQPKYLVVQISHRLEVAS